VRKRCASTAVLVLCSTVTLLSASAKAQDSVADAAQKNRAKDTKVSSKRVWTNDDIASAKSPEELALQKETPESASAALHKFRMLGKEELGAGVLQQAGAPNVDFPNRKDWEQRLFEAKQAWANQIDRMEGHKDASQASQEEELRLAVGKQRIFERMRAEGVEQARAEKDPVLKARRAYKRQEDFCKQTSGDLRDRCEIGLDQLKLKMQREGIW
jgi:hypothetical protein